MEDFTGGGNGGDRESIESGASDEKSVNGEKARHKEPNGDVSAEEPRTNKGSRRTTSLLNLFIPLSQGESSTRSPYTSISSWTAGFLRSRREKKKDKKTKKKDTSNGKEDKSDADEKDGSHQSETPTAEIDDEGYTVRPKTTFEQDKNSFYSSSESDSDDEREKRLRIEIKPLSNGGGPLSASVDELRTTVENMTLSPVGISGRKLILDAETTMKRSQSVSQRIGSSPPPRHQYTPLSPPAPTNHRTNTNTKIMGTDSTSRYSELADIFNEVGDIQPTLPLKTGTYRNTPTPTSGLVAIPRPPSRPRPEGLFQRNQSSPSPAISRTESIGSLDTRSIGSSYITGSRGPSPLTIGMSDSIPLAVAFHEIVHARFKGNDETMCQVKMTGDMMLSFPAGILHVFASNPNPSQLSFQIRTLQRLDNLVWNKELVSIQRDQDDLLVEFNMSALVQLLKKNSEQNPNASYFNVNILKYHVTPKPGASSCPLHLVAFWKFDSSQIDLRIDYKYNTHAMTPKSSQTPIPNMTLNTKNELPPLLQVCIAAQVDGAVKSMQSKPTGQWFPNTMRACWKLPSISTKTENQGVGTLRARLEVTSCQSSVGSIAAQFSCENSTLSGNEFYLIGTGYRVSLIKKCFVSGKYTCDAEESSNPNNSKKHVYKQ